MASLKGLTVEAVDTTLAEFDAIGRDAFLAKYNFGEAKGLYLVRDGKRYDSKAVVGAAVGRVLGRSALQGPDFTGGVASVVRALEKLGYAVVDERPTRNPRWATEEVILALDLYLTRGLLDDRAAEVIELSAALNALDIHPARPDAERWRNPNGVALKLANFAHVDPGYPGRGMTGGSTLDRRAFQRLKPYPDLVSASQPTSVRVLASTSTTCRSLPIRAKTATPSTLRRP
jgi:5-methylcytosine-specific restriction protein A